MLALFGWLLWSVSARQALLLLVGVGLGATLAGARFGFTTGWRHLVERRDPAGVYGQPFVQDTWAEIRGERNEPRAGPDYAATLAPIALDYVAPPPQAEPVLVAQAPTDAGAR